MCYSTLQQLIKDEGLEKYYEIYLNYGHDLEKHAFGCASISLMLIDSLKIRSKSERKDILVASLFHDIGETQFPHRFFTKPILNDKDKLLIEKHPQISVNMLANNVSPHVKDMILAHHMDDIGNGYGFGLPDKDTNIMRVADIYSALISKRVYREAYLIEETISIMDKMSDKGHIDKEIWKCLRHFIH